MGKYININNIYKVNDKQSNNIDTLDDKIVSGAIWKGYPNEDVEWTYIEGTFFKKSDTELIYTGSRRNLYVHIDYNPSQHGDIIFNLKINDDKLNTDGYNSPPRHKFNNGDVITLSYNLRVQLQLQLEGQLVLYSEDM